MKHCIRIENLNSDPYSMIFLDRKDYEYCEYAYEVAEALTKLISDLQNKNSEFHIECVNTDELSEGEEIVTEILEENNDEITHIDF